jgi:hypothetical protein
VYILKTVDFDENIEFVTETWYDDETAEVGETRFIGKTLNYDRIELIIVVEEIFVLTMIFLSNPSLSQEQDQIAKAGLEMKLASSEVDAEADRWGAGEDDDAANEEGASVDERGNATKAHEDNDIVRRAKNMSGMALSMYEFTKGDGGSSLRTTQDLFTQAEYLAEEANRLYKLVRQFSYQVNNVLLSVMIYSFFMVKQSFF